MVLDRQDHSREAPALADSILVRCSSSLSCSGTTIDSEKGTFKSVIAKEEPVNFYCTGATLNIFNH